MKRACITQWRRCLSVILLGLSVPWSLCASDSNDGVLNPTELARAGLVRSWANQAELSVFDQVNFVQLHVSNSRATVFFEIFVGNKLHSSYASLDRDALGNRLGYERAKELADLQREIIEQEVAASLAGRNLSQAEYSELVVDSSPEAIAKRRQFLDEQKQKVEVRKYVEPRMTLYVLNGRNVLQAFDAESGNLRWKTQIGSPGGVSTGLAANDAMVAVTVGQRVYCLDADQGRILWNRRCQGLPSASPAMSHTHVFVPLMAGQVESFTIAKDGIENGYYVSQGSISAKPLVTGRTVSWPTDDGYYNVAYFDEIGSLKYRIHANGPIVTTPSKLGRVLFVPSSDGYVYAVDEVLGTIYWEFSTGSSISQPSLAIDDSVYVVTENEELYKIDSKSGAIPAAWPMSIPGFQRLIGSAGDLLYAEDLSGNLVAVRIENGAREFSIYVGDGLHLLNSQTDRIFLISRTGNIQCLRQTNQVHPLFHVPVSESITSMESSGEVGKANRIRRAMQHDEQIHNPFETKEELSQDPYSASEPVYKNPFLVESEGEVNPFSIESNAAAKSSEGGADGAKTGQEPAASLPETQPATGANDPFKGGRP